MRSFEKNVRVVSAISSPQFRLRNNVTTCAIIFGSFPPRVADDVRRRNLSATIESASSRRRLQIDRSAPSLPPAATHLGSPAMNFRPSGAPWSAAQATLSIMEAPVSVAEASLSATEATPSVTQATLTVAEASVSATEAVLTVAEASLSMTEATLSTIEATLSVTDKVASKPRNAHFSPKTAVFDLPTPISPPPKPAGDPPWLFLYSHILSSFPHIQTPISIYPIRNPKPSTPKPTKWLRNRSHGMARTPKANRCSGTPPA